MITSPRSNPFASHVYGQWPPSAYAWNHDGADVPYYVIATKTKKSGLSAHGMTNAACHFMAAAKHNRIRLRSAQRSACQTPSQVRDHFQYDHDPEVLEHPHRPTEIRLPRPFQGDLISTQKPSKLRKNRSWSCFYYDQDHTDPGTLIENRKIPFPTP